VSNRLSEIGKDFVYVSRGALEKMTREILEEYAPPFLADKFSEITDRAVSRLISEMPETPCVTSCAAAGTVTHERGCHNRGKWPMHGDQRPPGYCDEAAAVVTNADDACGRCASCTR
jgi:hypothetical protein